MVTAQSQIQLVDIEEELKHLWDDQQGKNKTRAALFTLIIYTQKDEMLSVYEELVEKAIGKLPSRIILIIDEPQAKEPYLRTSVAAKTVADTIYCEEIRIETGGELRQRVPYIVLPHLIPDLPVYLFWTQDPSSENAILSNLELFARRIIFDVHPIKKLQTYSQTLLKLLKRFRCEMGDLNWVAISGWRKILREAFNSPELIDKLDRSEKIVIQYNKSGSINKSQSELKAAYFQSWIAAQLNWKFRQIETKKEEIRLKYSKRSGEGSVLLIPREESKLPAGTLLSVDIESTGRACYVFKRHPDTRQVFFQYSEASRCDLPFAMHLSGFGQGQEIIEEIFYNEPGSHYRNMLQLLAQIPWKT